MAVEGSKSQRVYLTLRDAILSGRVAVGERMPGELELAARYGVSRVTVRRALTVLAEQGLLERRPGAGTVVKERPLDATVITADVSNLLPNMVKMSRASQIRLLEFAYLPAPRAVADALGLAPGDRVQYSVRVRSVDGAPFSYLVTHVPDRIARHYNEADLAQTPLFALLERSGVEVDRATQTISAQLAGPVEAEALDVAPGSPLIALTRVVFDAQGRGVEHLQALYRPDRYRIQVDLGREGGRESRYWKPLAETERPLVRKRASRRAPVDR
jgi:GntR family transcriptional regulator